MKGDLFAALLLMLAGCSTAERAPALPRPVPPFAGCIGKPPIATGKQVKARHDALDRLYDDCAVRLRKNLDATK